MIRVHRTPNAITQAVTRILRSDLVDDICLWPVVDGAVDGAAEGIDPVVDAAYENRSGATSWGFPPGLSRRAHAKTQSTYGQSHMAIDNRRSAVHQPATPEEQLAERRQPAGSGMG